MPKSMKHLLQESFVPALLVVLALFLSIIYAQYGTVRDSQSVTVIRIKNEALAEEEQQAEVDLLTETPLLAGEANTDPRLEEAAHLVKAGKLQQAEAVYQSIIDQAPDTKVFNDLGVLHLKKGDPEKALVYLNRALSTKPAYVRAYLNRALAYNRLGNDSAAISDYRSLIEKIPHHFEAHYNLGIIYLQKRDFENSARAFEKAKGLAGGERKARALLGLGSAYSELGRKADARSALTDAIRLRPDYIAPRLELAFLEEHTPKGNRRAMEQYEEVFKLKADYPPAYFTMARRHVSTGDLPAAEAAYRNAVKFDPEYHKAHYNLGLLFLSQRRYSEARAEFEWVVTRDPQHAEAHFNLARTAYGLKEFPAALTAYDRALALRGGNYPEAYLNRGLVLVAQKRYDEAEMAYERAIKLNKQYTEAWYNLGLLQLKQRRWKQARESLQTAIKYQPGYAQAWFNLGVLAGRENKDAAAIEAYRRAIAIRPDYPEARLNLAVRYAKQNRNKEAIAEYRALLEEDDTYSMAWLNLGLAYLETKENKDAEEALRRSLELEPNNLKAMKLLASALAEQGDYEDAIDVMKQAIALDAADPQLRLKLARILSMADKPSEARSELAKAQRLVPGNKRISQDFDFSTGKL